MTLESLVTEWRDAREAILLVNWGDPVVAKAHVHLWTRLGHAEAALMAHARDLPKPLTWDEWASPEIQIIPPGPYVDPRQPGADPEFTVFPSALERMELRSDGLYMTLDTPEGFPLKPGQSLEISWSPPTPQPVEIIVHEVPRTEPKP